jgi:hypothetical protein
VIHPSENTELPERSRFGVAELLEWRGKNPTTLYLGVTVAQTWSWALSAAMTRALVEL